MRCRLFEGRLSKVGCGFHIEPHVVQLADIHGMIFGRCGSFVDPVDHVCAVTVESTHDGLKPTRAETCAYLKRGVTLRLKIKVSLLCRV